MATLQQNVAEKFLAKLKDGKSLDAEKVEQLRKLLTDSKKPKAEDFIKIFTALAGGDVK
jgi:preprotein translocase subunit Sss1